MTDDQMRRLRGRAHLHGERCYGRYEPCGEHHVHDETCGSRMRLCRTEEDHDLVALLEEYDALLEERNR